MVVQDKMIDETQGLKLAGCTLREAYGVIDTSLPGEKAQIDLREHRCGVVFVI